MLLQVIFLEKVSIKWVLWAESSVFFFQRCWRAALSSQHLAHGLGRKVHFLGPCCWWDWHHWFGPMWFVNKVLVGKRNYQLNWSRPSLVPFELTTSQQHPSDFSCSLKIEVSKNVNKTNSGVFM